MNTELKLKGLADAAENYHTVLAENRRLYNEVQDLKGICLSYWLLLVFVSSELMSNCFQFPPLSS